MIKMKPKSVDSVLFIDCGGNNKLPILFQCAIHWAEQGYKVLYISNTFLNKLPPTVHGTSTATDAFSQIRFMSLPRWQDLLQHLYTLHRFALVPQVVIVERLDHYCFPGIVETEPHDADMHSAMICASLFDTMSVCAYHFGKPALLVASITNEHLSKLSHIVDNFFSDLVWLSESVEGDGGDSNGTTIQVTKLDSNPGPSENKGLEFTIKTDDFIMLKKIFSVMKKPS